MNRLHYQVDGNPAGSAIMLLHGFMSSNAQWLANLERLGHRHRLVRVELWGHGRSPEPVTLEQYSVEAYLRQFELIRSELDIPRWQLIGQSYGAGLIIRYALTHPDRCESLVVTNSRSAFGVLPPRRRRDPDAPSQDPFDAPGFTLRDLPYHPINARRFPESVKTALVADADAMPVSAVRNGGRLGAGLNCVEALADLTVPMLRASSLRIWKAVTRSISKRRQLSTRPVWHFSTATPDHQSVSYRSTADNP
jgi:pimeloyl-ACP methyl ester carboxylesterase